MTPVEIIAAIFAVAVLVKLSFIAAKPEWWRDWMKVVIKRSKCLVWVYFALALIVGYYLLQSLTIVEVMASVVFGSLLMAMVLLQYPDAIIKIGRQMLKDRTSLFAKAWLGIVVYAALAVWVLYVLFV